MKRLLMILFWFAVCFWPLAVWGEEGPYVVSVDTLPYHVSEVCLQTGKNSLTSYDINAPTLATKEIMEDWVEALNEAHKWRTRYKRSKDCLSSIPDPDGSVVPIPCPNIPDSCADAPSGCKDAK